MEGRTLIKQIKKAAICFRDKANEIIDWCNLPWEVALPDDKFGEAKFNAGANKVTLDLSQLSTLRLSACDPDTGEQKVIVVFGYVESVSE